MVRDPITHHFGNPYMKEYYLSAGEWLATHAHAKDHTSVLLDGQALLMVDGEITELTGPCSLLIEAGKNHGIRAVTEISWFCIWESPEIELLDPDMTPQSALEKICQQ